MSYVSPYQVAAVQEDLLSSLLKTKQKEREGEFQGGIQKGEMIKEYSADLRDKKQKIDEAARKAARKKRKKKWWEKALPIASIFMGPLGAALTTGLTAGYGTYKDASFAGKTAKNLQKYIRQTPLEGSAKARAGFDPWQGTFLGETALDFKEGRLSSASDLDTAISQAKDAGSFGNVLGSAATAGLTTYLLKDLLGEIGGGKIDAMAGDILSGAGTSSITDIVARTHGPLANVFGGLTAGELFSGDTLGQLLEGSAQSEAGLSLLLGAISSLQD